MIKMNNSLQSRILQNERNLEHYKEFVYAFRVQNFFNDR